MRRELLVCVILLKLAGLVQPFRNQEDATVHQAEHGQFSKLWGIGKGTGQSCRDQRQYHRSIHFLVLRLEQTRAVLEIVGHWEGDRNIMSRSMVIAVLDSSYGATYYVRSSSES